LGVAVSKFYFRGVARAIDCEDVSSFHTTKYQL
jgi:hypothetical protein